MANEFITPNAETEVDGKYRLGAIVKRSIASTIYETEFRDADGLARPAVIIIRELDQDSSESAVARWRNAMDLAHPNLLRLYDAGVSVMDGVPVAWLVMERADESLAVVLAERALSEDEVREMLEPTVEALRYLHKNGYIHGDLKPSKVLAAGDRLKLTIDSAVRVADGGAPEEDMRALGGLILQALKQKVPEEGYSGLFTDIIRHCMEAEPSKRWTADQVAARLRSPAAAPQLAEPPTEHAPVETLQENRPSRKMPKWVFGGLAGLVLVVLLAAVLRKNDSAPAPVAAAPLVAHESPTANQALPSLAQPAPPPRNPAVRRAGGRRANGWSVIVAAYGSREAAEKRMRAMAGKWSNFHLSVLEEQTEKARYLVVLGENLSEDEAESLRLRAVRAGLPQDTYIKKLT